MYNTTDYCLPGEAWKGIPGYKGLYEASSFGRIRSVDGKVTHSHRHGVRRWRGRILKPKGCKDFNTTGYRVSLYKDNESKDWLVARLVAITFLGASDLTVNHKDGDRLNNRIDNLEWLSLADNIRHGYASGLYPSVKVVLVSKKESFAFCSMAAASRFLGKCNGYISNCVNKGIVHVAGKDSRYWIKVAL